VSETDLREAAQKIEQGAAEAGERHRSSGGSEFGHSLGIVAPESVQS
jgi:hypothetical protein